MKKKRLISRAVLRTELSVAANEIRAQNYGDALILIERVLGRVQEYDLIGIVDLVTMTLRGGHKK